MDMPITRIDADKAIALVREIANENPLVPEDWDNVCKYCRRGKPPPEYRAGYVPPQHDEDCLWLRAIKICNLIPS